MACGQSPGGRSAKYLNPLHERRVLTLLAATERHYRQVGTDNKQFCKNIGLNNAERLYRIQKGKNNISRKLAEIIHNAYPEYSVSWILCGTDYGSDASDVLNIPIYGTVQGLLSGKSARRIVISKSVAGNARCALRYRNCDPDTPKFMRDITLLLNRTDPHTLRHGKPYFIVTQHHIGIGVVIDLDRCRSVRYKCIMNRQSENRCALFSDISGVWSICGMVARQSRERQTASRRYIVFARQAVI